MFYSVFRAVKEANQGYGGFQHGGSRSLYQGLRTIMDYKPPSLRMVYIDAPLADELNTLYVHFKAATNSANSISSDKSATSSMHAERDKLENTFNNTEYKVR